MNLTSEQMAALLTERRNPDSMNVDLMSTREIIELIHREDEKAVRSIDSQIDNLEQAVELTVQAFRQGGRLFYVGAGTSGRLGVLDAAECPPTFSTPPEMVQGIIAGGWDALRRAVEKAEDFPENGAQAIQERGIQEQDVVAGIAASSTTPFVIGALEEAKRIGAKTLFITCNPNPKSLPEIDVIVTLAVGPEVITGSTRMKAGTATKLALNILTTTSMIRIGKVYQNLMIDLTATNKKLEDRSRRIIHTLTGLSYEEAEMLIQKANGRLKTALVMHFCSLSRDEAEARIEANAGRVQDIIPRVEPTA